MSDKNIIPLACRVPSILYAVSIEHGPDGVRWTKIHDVKESGRNQGRVAAALREAADMLAAPVAPAISESEWQPIRIAPIGTVIIAVWSDPESPDNQECHNFHMIGAGYWCRWIKSERTI